MPFRGREIEPRVLTDAQRNEADLIAIDEIRAEIRVATDADVQCDLSDQLFVIQDRYDQRNRTVEPRPSLPARIGQAAVRCFKAIPSRMMYPG